MFITLATCSLLPKGGTLPLKKFYDIGSNHFLRQKSIDIPNVIVSEFAYAFATATATATAATLSVLTATTGLCYINFYRNSLILILKAIFVYHCQPVNAYKIKIGVK
jgi:hypothetical protein